MKNTLHEQFPEAQCDFSFFFIISMIWNWEKQQILTVEILEPEAFLEMLKLEGKVVTD